MWELTLNAFALLWLFHTALALRKEFRGAKTIEDVYLETQP